MSHNVRAAIALATKETPCRAIGVVQRSHLDDAIARADALSRMVAEITDILQGLVDQQNGPPLERYVDQWQCVMDDARAILSRSDVTAEAGRWVLRADLDDAIANAAKARDEADALGLQVEALRERVRLADALSDAVVIVTAAHIDGHDMAKPMANVFGRNLAYRAVPGDVKVPGEWGVEFRNGGWLSTEAMRAGNGTPARAENAHRFATREAAEKESERWESTAKRLPADVKAKKGTTSNSPLTDPN